MFPNVVGNDGAFAAIKEDGPVVTWGDKTQGGNSDEVIGQLASGVLQVAGNGGGAFAALKEHGSIVTWGRCDNGGNSKKVSAALAKDVVQVVGDNSASAARKERTAPSSRGATVSAEDLPTK